MNQPIPRQGEKKPVPSGTASGIRKDFWKSFTVVSNPAEQFCLQRWYMLFILYYATIYLIALIKDIDYGIRFQKDAWYLLSKQHFVDSSVYAQSTVFLYKDNAWYYHLVIVGLFLSLYFYNRWRQKIPQVFQHLEQRHALSHPQQQRDSDYQPYRSAYQRALFSLEDVIPKAMVTAGVFFMSLILFGWYGFVRDYIPSVSSDIAQWGLNAVILEISRRLIKDVFYPSLFMFLAVSILWTVAITSIYLYKFTNKFPLEIQPGHPDQCGGLKFLGAFLLRLALLILVICTLLSIYIWYRVQYPGFNIWVISASLALLSGIFSSSVAFFVPLDAVHQTMVKKRQEYEAMLEEHMCKLEDRMRDGLYQGDTHLMQEARDELERLAALHPDKIGYAKWPFDRRILLTFLGSQVAPSVACLGTIINLILIFSKH